jgi:hypothetical protein
MSRFERVLFGLACALFGLCGGCSDSTAPKPKKKCPRHPIIVSAVVNGTLFQFPKVCGERIWRP